MRARVRAAFCYRGALLFSPGCAVIKRRRVGGRIGTCSEGRVIRADAGEAALVIKLLAIVIAIALVCR